MDASNFGFGRKATKHVRTLFDRFCAGFSDAGVTAVQALRRPASEKRQGRKSLRDRPLRRSAGAMGIRWWFLGLEGWRAAIEAVGLGAWIGLCIGAEGCCAG